MPSPENSNNVRVVKLSHDSCLSQELHELLVPCSRLAHFDGGVHHLAVSTRVTSFEHLAKLALPKRTSGALDVLTWNLF